MSSIAQLTPNSNTFEIILKVDEGELYNYGAIEVTSELKKLNSDIIRRTIPIEDNELYDASKIKLGLKNIREIEFDQVRNPFDICLTCYRFMGLQKIRDHEPSLSFFLFVLFVFCFLFFMFFHCLHHEPSLELPASVDDRRGRLHDI